MKAITTEMKESFAQILKGEKLYGVSFKFGRGYNYPALFGFSRLERAQEPDLTFLNSGSKVGYLLSTIITYAEGVYKYKLAEQRADMSDGMMPEAEAGVVITDENALVVGGMTINFDREGNALDYEIYEKDYVVDKGELKDIEMPTPVSGRGNIDADFGIDA